MPPKSRRVKSGEDEVESGGSGVESPPISPSAPESSLRTDSASAPADAFPYNISRTTPNVLLRHDISDEELQVLVDMKRDYIWELKWVVVGIALGSAPSSLDHYQNFWTDRAPLSGGGLFSIVVTMVSLAIFVLLLFVMRSKSRTAEELAGDIRARTAQRVRG